VTIDSHQASEALSDINQIARRVRQSRIYHLSSLISILWGILVVAGNVATFAWPRHAGSVWIAVNVSGVAGAFAISAFGYPRNKGPGYDIRALLALLLFFAFGYFCTVMLGHFTPRQQGTFWPIYVMLIYTIVGLWVGPAFVAIGLGITALTLIGYFFVADWFPLWMAVVHGGGLILSGLWMRRV
jgi:hypothetical protein